MKMTKQQLKKLVREIDCLENRGFKDEDFLDEMAAEGLEDLWQMIADYRDRAY